MSRNEGINPNNILPGWRTAVASSRVTSTLNDAQPELGSHRKAAEAARASAIQDADVEYDSSAPPSRRGSSPPRSASEPDFEMNMPDGADEDEDAPPRRTRPNITIVSSDEEDEPIENEAGGAAKKKPVPKRKRRPSRSSPEPDVLDAFGMLADIPVVIDLEDDAAASSSNNAKSRDVKQFFEPPTGEKTKETRSCKICV
ncbi:hypothetical protein B0H14DRAFT_2572141 [Mycena olivaceomarginata]|nr:hypothetical protein B0H14DRAFT_2572141 [Mycena olivaceomarginata]